MTRKNLPWRKLNGTALNRHRLERSMATPESVTSELGLFYAPQPNTRLKLGVNQWKIILIATQQVL